MADPSELAPAALRRRCDPASIPFDTTDQVTEEAPVLGQARAEAALRVALGLDHDGFNVFALGPRGSGRHFLVQRALAARASEMPTPPDLAYVHNFAEPTRPLALHLPAGRGRALRDAMASVTEEAVTALRAAFETEEYQARLKAIGDEFKERSEARFREIQEAAQTEGLTMLATPVGMIFAPVQDGEVLDAEGFGKLPDEEQARLREKIQRMQQELQKVLRAIPGWDRERRESVRELDRQFAEVAVGHLLDEVAEGFRDLPDVARHLDAVRHDLIDNAGAVLHPRPDGEGDDDAQPPPGGSAGAAGPVLRRYRVNLLIDHGDDDGAPVVQEDNPTVVNLIGRVEHLARMGTLVTDFTLIRPGALHRAHGGFLVLDALQVLRQPYAWDALKRALTGKSVRIESVGQSLGLISTVTLEPEPAPLDTKLVLIGDRWLYYLLCGADPDFPDLVKIAADFEDDMPRDADHEEAYARLVAGVVRDAGLPPMDRTAVARVIEHAARGAGDGDRLSTQMADLVDLLREAALHAGDARPVGAHHVQHAIEQRRFRSGRVPDRVREAMLRGTLTIATEGALVGQINGLSVVQLGTSAFGRPSRITARVRLGRGEVVDIEREVELGGPLHSKGVLILSGLLGARYAVDRPLSLAATLVFEQSYGGVDGDSASSAELYALLSAIADVPLRQCLAVTGSIDQHGNVQAIGGVNEKVEGFYDLCRERGLTGDQGVVVPRANVHHLMLREDVVDAVAGGRFRVYAVDTVDEGMALLTGLPPGERGPDGKYPPESLDGRVQARLETMARRWAAFAERGEAGRRRGESS